MKYGLDQYDTATLKAELLRREEEEKMPPNPKPYDECQFADFYDIMTCIMQVSNRPPNQVFQVFKAAIDCVYGPKFWDWYDNVG